MSTPAKDISSRRISNDARFWWVAAFSVVVRLVTLGFIWQAPLSSDAQDYLEMAHRLLAGQHFVPYWPPGLPLFLMPTIALGGSTGMLRLSMMLFWVLLVFGLYRISRIIGIEQWAWKILLVFAITPAAIHLSITPLTQLPVAALLVIALGSLMRCVRGGPLAEYAVLGATLGAMALIRPSALALCLLILLPAVRTRKFAGAAISFVMVALLCGGWMIRAHALSGGWVFNTSNSRNLWYGNNPDTPYYRTWYFGSHAKPGSAEIDQFPAYKQTLAEVSQLGPFDEQKQFSHLAKQYILEHPGAFLLRTINRVRCYWAFDTFTSLNWRRYMPRVLMPSLALEAITYLLLVGPAFFCIAAAGRSFWWKVEAWILLGAVILYAAPYWVSMSHPTYHFPVVLPVAIAGAMVLQRSSISWRSHKGWIAGLILLAIQVEWVWIMRHVA